MAFSMTKWFTAILGLISIILGSIYSYSLGTEHGRLFFMIQICMLIQIFFLTTCYLSWNSILKVMNRSSSQTRLMVKGCLLLFYGIVNTTIPVYAFMSRTYPHWYSVLTFLSFGTHIQIGLALIFLHILFWMLALTGIIQDQSQVIKDKQVVHPNTFFVRKLRVLLAIGYGVSISLYGFYQASQLPTIKYVTIPIAGLPPSLDGFRIAQLCDIHLGPMVGRPRMEDIVSMTNDLKPGNTIL